MQPIRIQKALSEAGVASRRAAEELVRQGRVTVNGRKAEIGQSVNPDRDVIAVDGKRVYFTRKKQYRYIMMNKPRGYVTTLSDELGRRCVTDLLTGVEERVYPIGRLDMDSEGLLLFTNDGAFANLLMHPSHEVEKAYEVLVSGFSPEKLPLLERPIVLDGYHIRPPKVRLLESTGQKARLEVVIHEGRNRQVRRMCQAAGMEVLRLKRTREGSLTLGDLPAGKWRSLTQAEIEKLKK